MYHVTMALLYKKKKEKNKNIYSYNIIYHIKIGFQTF
jgi:hypothetical protein